MRLLLLAPVALLLLAPISIDSTYVCVPQPPPPCDEKQCILVDKNHPYYIVDHEHCFQ